MTVQQRCGMPLAPGDPARVGRHELRARLAVGGMGVVYLARSASGRQVAVKVMHEGFAGDPELRARFRQEVAVARRVGGAFTAPVVAADTDARLPWMATRYIPGMPLSWHVSRHGPLSPQTLWRLAAGLAEALQEIHRVGVVHRDLKPANVLLSEDGPKVIDFGVSRTAESEVRTETGKVVGTVPFMAPEQVKAAGSVGPPADVFALGSVLVHAATGRGPFDADGLYAMAYRVVHARPNLDGLPGAMRPLVMHCLAKDADDRPTAAELLVTLFTGQARQAEQAGRADQADEPRQSGAPGTSQHPMATSR